MEQEAARYSGSEYELSPLVDNSAPVDGHDGSRRSVRIDSTASVIPPAHTYSRISQDDVESTVPMPNEAISDAEHLWKAHSQGGDTYKRPSDPAFEDSDNYAVSSSSQGGVFYQLLQAYKNAEVTDSQSPLDTGISTPKAVAVPSTGRSTPRRKWYEREKGSQDTLATLVGASTKLASPSEKDPDPTLRHRAHHRRTGSGKIMSKIFHQQEAQDVKIKVHVATILQKQKYIIKLCRAMMLFGAPTHRLEESLAQSAKILDINSQFLYIPGCMLMSFDDVLTHTAEVKIVRVEQGVNLSKLEDTHDIYKEVLHDVIGVEEGLSRLDEVINRKSHHPIWLRVLMYGLASTAVSCFFKARPIDFPIIFLLGILLGTLQLVVVPLSKTYSTVFEITASVLITFIARAIGSIRGGSIFCFSALAQSGIAIILPGWLVLSSALELQSKAIVPGSIRLVYAIIYSLFLGYGITLGATLYGAMDPNATTSTTCTAPLNPYWNFLFVPLYVFFVSFMDQAKYKQMPSMIIIATCGYIVNFYSNKRFSASQPIAYTLGAFAVGVLANLYSRLRRGVAAAILLPAVYVQVPGSLASSGSIVAALNTATSLVQSTTDSNTSSTSQSLDTFNSIVFNFAGGMIQISLGITVGLFMSALLVYPLGKRRSGLWTL